MFKRVQQTITPGFVALMFAFTIALYVHGENERLSKECVAQLRK